MYMSMYVLSQMSFLCSMASASSADAAGGTSSRRLVGDQKRFEIEAGRRCEGLIAADRTLAAWPALYIAEDFETAFREKFQLPCGSLENGLTPQDMALKRLKKKLKTSDADFFMVKSARQLFDAVLKHNWRVEPRQFGMPSPSQTLAELIRAAGFEAILYQSSKGPGKCLAVFPDRLLDGSFVELADAAPPEVRHSRLDSSNGNDLCGWDSVAPQFRARKV
jgi:hypothetical protein